jgi:hypothetical protein
LKFSQVCKQKIYINVDEEKKKWKFFRKIKEKSGDKIVEMHYVSHLIV